MRLLIQRVQQASVTIGGALYSFIGDGMLVFVGIENTDTNTDVIWLANKLVNLRIFDDESGVMNRSLQDVQGELLIVSQFTLHASTRKGNRPSYIAAAPPQVAIPLYECFLDTMRTLVPNRVQMGQFGADMQVSLVNDGPVTILIDSKVRE